MRDSCGSCGQVRPLTAQSGKGLTACPAESEQPEAEINYIQDQLSINCKEKNFSTLGEVMPYVSSTFPLRTQKIRGCF